MRRPAFHGFHKGNCPRVTAVGNRTQSITGHSQLHHALLDGAVAAGAVECVVDRATFRNGVFARRQHHLASRRQRLPRHRKRPVRRNRRPPAYLLGERDRPRIGHAARPTRLRHRQPDGAVHQRTRAARRAHLVARRPTLRHRIDASFDHQRLVVVGRLRAHREAEGAGQRGPALHRLTKGDRPRVARKGKGAGVGARRGVEGNHVVRQAARLADAGQGVVVWATVSHKITARHRAQRGVACGLLAGRRKAPVARLAGAPYHLNIHHHIGGAHIGDAYRIIRRGRAVGLSARILAVRLDPDILRQRQRHIGDRPARIEPHALTQGDVIDCVSRRVEAHRGQLRPGAGLRPHGAVAVACHRQRLEGGQVAAQPGDMAVRLPAHRCKGAAHQHLAVWLQGDGIDGVIGIRIPAGVQRAIGVEARQPVARHRRPIYAHAGEGAAHNQPSVGL